MEEMTSTLSLGTCACMSCNKECSIHSHYDVLFKTCCQCVKKTRAVSLIVLAENSL